MSRISDRINADDRLSVVCVDDENSQSFITAEVAPVLATPAVAGAVTLVAAGAAYGEAVD